MGVNREAVVQAPRDKRQAFAHMTENDLEVGKTIEHPTEQQAQGMTGRFNTPAPRRAAHFRMAIEYLREHIGI
ncbi:hypothetical protein D3C86_2242300 [compost metagenome]